MTSIFNEVDIEQLEMANNLLKFDQILLKKNICSPAIISYIRSVYRFATNNNYSCNQKEKLVNFALKLIFSLSDNNLEKSVFAQDLRKRTMQMAIRGNDLIAIFSLNEAENIYLFFKKQIMPYYQIYETILDKSPHFTIEAQNFEPVQVLETELPLEKGTVVQVDNIDFLKDYIGVRQPKEEKKDPKKK